MRNEYDLKKMKGCKNPYIQDLRKFKGKDDLEIDYRSTQGRIREIHRDLLDEEQCRQEPEANEYK